MKYSMIAILHCLFSMTLFSQSLYLSNSPQFVNLGDLDISGDKITLEAIITQEYDYNYGNDIISKHRASTDCNYLLRPRTFEINCGGQFHFLINPYNLDLLKRYHIAGVYDGNSVKLFINGCKVAEENASGDMVQNDLLTVIGDSYSLQNELFYGYIEEVRIWNIARTEDEIKANLNNLPNPKNQTGLVAYYKFEGANPYENLQGNIQWNGTPFNNPEIKSNPYNDGLIIPFSIDSIEITNVSKFNSSDGKVIIHAINGTKKYQYSSDGINYQSDSVFSNLKAGTYKFFVNDVGCIFELDIDISQPEKTNVSLKIPDYICAVGTENFKLALIAFDNNTDFSNLSFTTKLKFNASSFFPTGITKGTITENVVDNFLNRILTIQCDGVNISNSDTTLTEIIGTVLLGDTLTTLEILDFKWYNSNIEIDTIINGSLETKACALKLRRVLFTPPNFSIQPNPASNNLSIKIDGDTEDIYNLEIYNVQGIRIYQYQWLNKKDRKIECLINSFNYSNGVYYVVLKTTWDTIAKPLMIVK